jgi:hypothetical protein
MPLVCVRACVCVREREGGGGEEERVCVCMYVQEHGTADAAIPTFCFIERGND